MPRLTPIGAMIAVAATLSVLPVLAQQAGDAAAPSSTAPAGSPSPPSAPDSPTGVVATTNNPNLAVASLKLESGVRASKIIGEAVRNEQNQQVGTVADLILSPESKVTMAIVSVGGFLGVGSKLVAIPWDQIKTDGGKLTLPGATKDSLNAAPTFQY